MYSLTGNTSNFLFWPGGFEEPKELEEPERALMTDVDFDNNLRTLAKGFKSGIEFKSDNFTPKISQAEGTAHVESEESREATATVNLIAIVNEEANLFKLWSKTVSETKPEEKNINDHEVSSHIIDEITKPSSEPKIPLLKISEHTKTSSQAEWAEELDVSVAVSDFDKKVPDPAIKFKYELDNFQKQAIIKLEEDCNVFVAAHTSAGKTTVAEYAIALSQRHKTR